MGFAPLFDTTEARYANMAQHMLLRQDWLVPYIPAFNGPFLGKPPLSFWLQAASLWVQGHLPPALQGFFTMEWAARLPNALEALACVALTYWLAQRLYGKTVAVWSAWILASTGFFFVIAASVSMDMLVCLSTLAVLAAGVGLVQAQQQAKPLLPWQVALGLGLCLGMMSKGPVTWVLALGPVVLWVLLCGRPWRTVWASVKALGLGWVLAAAVALCAPWFLAVQQRHGDFFTYFFLQEHLLRYITPNYGDRYGAGHHQPYGASWVFTVLAFLPWSLLVLPQWAQRAAHGLQAGLAQVKMKEWQPFVVLSQGVSALQQGAQAHPYTALLACFAFFPALFFTAAKSLIMMYVIGALPPLALLLAGWLAPKAQANKVYGFAALALGGCTSVAIALWYTPLPLPAPLTFPSAKRTVVNFKATAPTLLRLQQVGQPLAGLPLYVWKGTAPFSYYLYTQQPLVQQVLSQGKELPLSQLMAVSFAVPTLEPEDLPVGVSSPDWPITPFALVANREHQQQYAPRWRYLLQRRPATKVLATTAGYQLLWVGAGAHG
jgi:4-amino-4-deoxy-L-arabinose transferase-like glycosyltransferase